MSGLLPHFYVLFIYFFLLLWTFPSPLTNLQEFWLAFRQGSVKQSIHNLGMECFFCFLLLSVKHMKSDPIAPSVRFRPALYWNFNQPQAWPRLQSRARCFALDSVRGATGHTRPSAVCALNAPTCCLMRLFACFAADWFSAKKPKTDFRFLFLVNIFMPVSRMPSKCAVLRRHS